MKVKRRTIVKTGALAIGALALNGCKRLLSERDMAYEGLIGGVEERLGGGIPDDVVIAVSKNIDPDFHFLNRLSFGLRPGDLNYIKEIGRKKWLSEQLDYKSIDDRLCDFRVRRFESRFLTPGDCFDIKREVLRSDLVRHTLLKSIYSKRQLLEVMVNFWNDHLNINIEKGDCVYFKTLDDRDVVRKHALGKFRELIRSSALSPAMLEYLDGKENKKASEDDIPNENYARELLELHTLGVDGGYEQKDVLEAARCLTGWRIKDKFGRGSVFFEPKFHDNGGKVVLGKVIPTGGGEKDLDRLIDIACRHKSTSMHIARKLVRHFVSDQPQEALAAKLARQFRDTDGDIKSVLELLFFSKEFLENRGNKVKRPYRFLVSSLRATAANTFARRGLFEYLSRMGQEPFQYPTPDGYPEETLPWLGTLLWRWNFALALPTNEVPSVKVKGRKLVNAILKNDDGAPHSALIFQYLVGRKPTRGELGAFEKFEKATGSDNGLGVMGLVIASPAFQRY